MLKRKPIVVVGSINIDFVSNAARIPVKGETVTGLDFQIHPGGKGANQAVAIARLGYPVRMIGKLGSDFFGTQLRAHLQDAGVDTTAVSEISGSSGSAVIVVSPEGENMIIVNPGANAALAAEDIEANLETIREAGIVLTQLETPLETVECLARICTREGVPLLLDPAPAIELPPELIGQARWFTPNETEAAFYSGDGNGASPRETAHSLLDQGLPLLLQHRRLQHPLYFLHRRHGRLCAGPGNGNARSRNSKASAVSRRHSQHHPRGERAVESIACGCRIQRAHRKRRNLKLLSIALGQKNATLPQL